MLLAVSLFSLWLATLITGIILFVVGGARMKKDLHKGKAMKNWGVGLIATAIGLPMVIFVTRP